MFSILYILRIWGKVVASLVLFICLLYIYIYIFYGSLILDSLAFIWDKSLCTKNKKFKLDTLPKIKLNLEAN